MLRTQPADVVVVGAGLGGLATAIRVAADGHHVTLLERDPIPGGRAGQILDRGFTFDTGPSVMTMPALVADLYALHGERMQDHLTMERLDPAYRATFHDGSVVRIRGSVAAMTEEVRQLAGPAEADNFVRFAGHLKKLYEAEYETFIDANFDSPLDLARPDKMVNLIRLGGFRKVANLVGSFLTDWRLQRLFTFQSMYAGMSPYEALGIYAVIAYMDAIAGVYGVKGGIHAIAEGLADLASRQGVDIRYGAEVAEVTGTGKRANGVRLVDGTVHHADVVVLNPDLPIAYRDLLPPRATPARVKRLTFSPSCTVVHLGLDRKLLDAAHHNIHFAEDYQASFDDILAGRLQRDPSWFLSVPTHADPDMAPGGGEVAFVLVPSPNLNGDPINWTHQGQREVAATIERLEQAKYGPVGDSVVTSHVVTPQDWADMGMAAGTPFAASHHFRQTGPFRPANVAPKVDGVVFVGSSTTPGVGVPMVLVSGRLAAERVAQQLEQQP
jgi:phytoene desaturase